MKDQIFGLLITQTWQIAALVFVVAVVVKIVASNRPHLAYSLWMLVLIKCVTPPLWGHSLGVFSQLQVRFTPDQSDATVIDSETNTSRFDAPALMYDKSSASNLNSSEFAADNTDYKIILIATTFTGTIVTLLIMFFRCIGCLRRIHRERTTEFDEPLRNRIQQLSEQLRIHRVPQIIVSNVHFGPAVIGILRYTIVMPRCLFEIAGGESANESTSTQNRRIDFKTMHSGCFAAHHRAFLDPILTHELLHIRRFDLRTGTLQALAQSLWWFHPAVWFSNRWLSREVERCCDEQVIAELRCTPGQYARALLSVIECKHRLVPIPVFPGMKPIEITLQRMERIMSLQSGLHRRTPVWCWLLIVALAIVVLPGAAATLSEDVEASVAASLIHQPKQGQTKVEASPVSKHKVHVTHRTFAGNMFWADGDLQRHLPRKKSFWNYLCEAFDTDTIQADSEALAEIYRGVGFFDVQITGEPQFSGDRSEVNLHFTVTEGRRYRIRDVRFQGNNRITASDLQKGCHLKPGDLFNSHAISMDLQRIHKLYERLGLEPTLNPVPHFTEENGILDLVFEIDEMRLH